MTQQITLGGGCFWCLEGAFKQVRGVLKVQSGYAGGHKAEPTYEEVCKGDTGHAEVVQITFDPAALSVREIYEIFFALHDPTQVNRQGNDVGTQYRTSIFYQTDEQKRLAEEIIAEMEREQTWDAPIVTTIEPLEKFWRWRNITRITLSVIQKTLIARRSCILNWRNSNVLLPKSLTVNLDEKEGGSPWTAPLLFNNTAQDFDVARTHAVVFEVNLPFCD